jgi:hypothetical protein
MFLHVAANVHVRPSDELLGLALMLTTVGAAQPGLSHIRRVSIER